MKQTLSMIGASALIAVGISACGGAGTAVSAHKVATDPHVQQDVQKAKVEINKCGGWASLIRKGSRQKVITCLAPPSKRVQLENCISTAASRDHLWRKSGRQQFVIDAAGCIVR